MNKRSEIIKEKKYPSQGCQDESQYDCAYTSSGCLIFVFIIGAALLLLLSCSHYQYYVTETKITISGEEMHVQEMKKRQPMKDTTITAMMITKRRVR